MQQQENNPPDPLPGQFIRPQIATSNGGNPVTGLGLVRDLSYTDLSAGGGGRNPYFPIYDPAQDEWVMLAAGSAGLEIGNSGALELPAGDRLLISIALVLLVSARIGDYHGAGLAGNRNQQPFLHQFPAGGFRRARDVEVDQRVACVRFEAAQFEAGCFV